MAPKKKGGGKKKKSNKPAWMSDEMYELSTNLVKLMDTWNPEDKDKKGGGAKPLKAGEKEPPTISRDQAGLFIWQMLYPNNKAGKSKRIEAVKLSVVEVSVKVLSMGKPAEMTPALGILAAMTEGSDPQRQVMIDAKPNPMPHLLASLEQDSAPLRTAACALMYVVISKEDTRPRLWRLMKEWDWTPLFNCLNLLELSSLGGRNAALDTMRIIDTMVNLTGSPVNNNMSNASCSALVQYKGLEPIVSLLKNRIAHPMAKASGLSILNQILRRSPGALAESVIVGQEAMSPIVNLFHHYVVPLLHKAYGASCLLRFAMPDALWKDSSALSAGSGGKKATPGAEGDSAPAGPTIADSAESPEPAAAASAPAAAGAAAASPAAVRQTSGTGAPPAPAPRTSTSGAAGKADLRQAINDNLEGFAGGGSEPTVSDLHLLDEATREEVMARARIVAEAGAVHPLILMCNGPAGPLEDLEAKAAADAAAKAAAEAAGEPLVVDDGKKKGKKGKKAKGKKGKKGKLEPGMAEAQTYSSAVLRLISLSEEWREPLVKAGAIRYLLPLLNSKLNQARWNARQTLINLSMSTELMPTLKLYSVPEYIHAGNIPHSHFERPYSDGEDDLEKLPPHLQSVTTKIKTTLAGKPPIMKPRVGTTMSSSTGTGAVPTARQGSNDGRPRRTSSNNGATAS